MNNLIIGQRHTFVRLHELSYYRQKTYMWIICTGLETHTHTHTHRDTHPEREGERDRQRESESRIKKE